MSRLSTLLVTLVVVLAAFTTKATAFSLDGYPAGCIFSKTLHPYTNNATYNQSALSLNNLTRQYNAPVILFNDFDSPYAFDGSTYGGEASVFGTLPKHTSLKSLTANAQSQVSNWAAYGNDTSVGATYYFLWNGYQIGSSQGVFQITKSDKTNGVLEIDVGVFTVATLSQGGASANCFDLRTGFDLKKGRCASDHIVTSNQCGGW